MTFDRLNARKSLRKRTRPSDQHILPIISSLHEAQSQTQRGPGESTVRRGSLRVGPSSGRPLNSDVVVGIGIVAAVLQESQLKDPSEPSASSNLGLNLSAAAAVRIRVCCLFLQPLPWLGFVLRSVCSCHLFFFTAQSAAASLSPRPGRPLPLTPTPPPPLSTLSTPPPSLRYRELLHFAAQTVSRTESKEDEEEGDGRKYEREYNCNCEWQSCSRRCTC